MGVVVLFQQGPVQRGRAPEQAPLVGGRAKRIVMQIGPAHHAIALNLRRLQRGKRLAHAHVAVGKRRLLAHSQMHLARSQKAHRQVAFGASSHTGRRLRVRHQRKQRAMVAEGEHRLHHIVPIALELGQHDGHRIEHSV